MTPQGLIDTFRDLADDHATPPLWSDAVVMTYAADGELEAARRTRLLLDMETAAVCEIATVSGTPSYAVDPRVIFVRRVKLDSQTLPLPKASIAALDAERPGWDAEATGGPECWVPVGANKIRLFPTPNLVTTARLHVIREPLAPIALAYAATAAAVTGITSAAGTATAILAVANATLVTGDSVTFAGATPSEYNGAKSITVVNSTTVTYPVTGGPASPATGTITYVLNVPAVAPEISSRYHMGIVKWILHRAFMHRERQDMYRPEESARYLSEFEQEFGKKSAAVDETWIHRKHGYDEFEGVY